MSECPEYEDKQIPDDCYTCELYMDGECVSGKVEIAVKECPYGENWNEAIPGACGECEYYDDYSCFHPKKE